MVWSDITVIAIVAVVSFLGMRAGLIQSVFRLGSFLISIIIAIKLYPVVGGFLKGTFLFEKIKHSISDSLLNRIGHEGTASVDIVMREIPLPEFLKTSITRGIASPAEMIDKAGIVNSISSELTEMIISVISLILVYVVVRVIMYILRNIIKGITKLPVIKQFDKIGGLGFGLVQGLLIVYIACTVLLLFSSSESLQWVFMNIENSYIAKYFYENNIIVNFMFP